MISLEALADVIDVFLLVFVRMTGLFVIAPIFARRNIPTGLKLGLAFFLSLILINTLPGQELENYNSIYGFMALASKEFITGVTIGYTAYLVFTAIYLAGQIIDMQIGFGMANVMDPVSNIQVPITSNFYFILGMLLFLMANGHHILIQALFQSYEFIPLGGAVFSEALINDIIRAFGNIFLIGFKISAPVVAAVLITDIVIGIASRTVPQLNIFVVGLPLKIVLGLVVITLTIPLFVSIVDVLINGMESEIFNFMRDMGNNGQLLQ